VARGITLAAAYQGRLSDICFLFSLRSTSSVIMLPVFSFFITVSSIRRLYTRLGFFLSFFFLLYLFRFWSQTVACYDAFICGAPVVSKAGMSCDLGRLAKLHSNINPVAPRGKTAR